MKGLFKRSKKAGKYESAPPGAAEPAAEATANESPSGPTASNGASRPVAEAGNDAEGGAQQARESYDQAIADRLAQDAAPSPLAAPGETDAPAETPAATGSKDRKPGFLARLRQGLAKSSGKLSGGIAGIFSSRKLDDETLEELEDLLVSADLGPRTASKLTEDLADRRFGKEVTPAEVKASLADQAAKILQPLAKPLVPEPANNPHIVLVVGVNGTGKTTTIGKLAEQYRRDGYKVAIAAADTFRAAAVEQLHVWGERSGAQVFSRATGADAAGLVYDAIEQARRDGADILLIDTAGRLQNKQTLMAELQKIVRVTQKLAPDGPHDTVLILDATTGQNAVSQAETFKDMVNVTGVIVTKLDGSARGGVLVAVGDRLGLPIHAVGVGESVADLRPFDPDAFARSLLGQEPAA